MNTAVEITDHKPSRVRDARDLLWAGLWLLLSAGVIGLAVFLHSTTSGVQKDFNRVSTLSALRWVLGLPMTLLQTAVILVLMLVVFSRLLMTRQWWRTLASAVSFAAGLAIGSLITLLFHLLGQQFSSLLIPGKPAIFGVGTFELLVATTALLACATGRTRDHQLRWVNSAFAILLILDLITSYAGISAASMALFLGLCIGQVCRYAFGTRSQGLWGQDLVTELRRIGFDPVKLSRKDDVDKIINLGAKSHASFSDDLSAISRIYHMKNADGARYTVSVLDEQRHTGGYISQWLNSLKIQGITIRHDTSVRQTAEHHMLVLMALASHNISPVQVVGMGDAGESTFLVFESAQPHHHIHSLDLTSASPAQIRELWEQMEQAHRFGITHRNITPSCVGIIPQEPTSSDQTMALDKRSLESLANGEMGTAVLAGWEMADLASSSLHIAVDRVQLLVMLAATLGVDKTVEVLRATCSDATLASLSPYIQTVIVPSATKQLPGYSRKMMKALQSRLEALSEKEAVEEMGETTTNLSRFNAKKFISIVLLLVAMVALFTQLNLEQMINAVKTANPLWAAISLAFSLVSWLGSALAFGIFIDRDRRRKNIDGIIGTQAVASFTAVSMPTAAGPLAVNTLFLKKIGMDTTQAIATATADTVAEFTTTFLMFIVLGLAYGQAGLENAIPGKAVLLVIGAVAAVIAVAMLIPRCRHWIITTVVPQIKNYGHQMVILFSHPSILSLSVFGSIIQNTTLAASFWTALLAFGYHADFIQTLFLFLLVNAVGTAVPTPGGLGAVETLLSVTFTGIGVPSPIAVSATLLFRFWSYWVRMALGYVYMKHMQKHGLL